MYTSKRGDSVELGLFVKQLKAKTSKSNLPSGGSLVKEGDDLVDRLKCTFRISHHFSNGAKSETDVSSSALSTDTTSQDEDRPQPLLSSHVVKQLLIQIGASLTVDASQQRAGPSHSCDIVLTLDYGSSAALNSPDTTIASTAGEQRDAQTAGEPTVEQLTTFMIALKGQRVSFYAKPNSSFSRHLTSYMSSWNMDVVHVASKDEPEDQPSAGTTAATDGAAANLNSLPRHFLSTTDSAESDAKPPADTIGPKFPSFVLIDDNLQVLRERIRRLAQTPNVDLQTLSTTSQTTVSIIHFSSLGNFKAAKEIVQTLATLPELNVPEIMIIPKPIGPRRFLTALRTATAKPFVHSLLRPTATIPVPMPSAALLTNEVDDSAMSKKSGASKGKIDDSLRTIKVEGVTVPSASPRKDTLETFSDAAVHLGTTVKSGLWIHNPEGEKAGVFFHPGGKSHGQLTNHSAEREAGPQSPQEDVPVATASRLPVANEDEIVVFNPSSSATSPRPASSSRSDSAPKDVAVTAVVKRVTSHRTEMPILQGTALFNPRKNVLTESLRPIPVIKPAELVTPIIPILPEPLPAIPPILKTTMDTPKAAKKGELKETEKQTLKGKGKKDENDIVPPISVLIVDGKCI